MEVRMVLCMPYERYGGDGILDFFRKISRRSFVRSTVVSVIINNKLPWHTSIAHIVVVLNDVDCRHQQIEQHYLKPTDR